VVTHRFLHNTLGLTNQNTALGASIMHCKIEEKKEKWGEVMAYNPVL